MALLWSDLVIEIINRLEIINIIGEPFKIKTRIKNIDLINTTNFSYKIHVTGGLFGKINQIKEGNVTDLAPGAINTIEVTPIIGFGPIKIEATLEVENTQDITQETVGFVFLFFVVVN